jgi:CHAT domain-containing protein/tetratricopeptide (TPR) repeat protein
MRARHRARAVSVAIATMLCAGMWLCARPAATMAQAPPADSAGARLQREGIAAFGARRYDDAERLFIGALAEFEREGNLLDQAHALRNLSFLPRLSTEQRVALTERALDVAAASGDAAVPGLVRHQLSDLLYIQGDYAGAFAHIDAAVALLEAPPVRAQGLARALTSRGRLLRAVGRSDEALADQARAATLLEGIADWDGASQARHGLGLTLTGTGRYEEGLKAFDAAIAQARRSGKPDRLALALAQAAWAWLVAGQPTSGLPLLEEAEQYRAQLLPSSQGLLDATWSDLLTALRRPAEALARIERALSQPAATRENELFNTWDKARLLSLLGRRHEALEVGAAATALTERLWQRMVPFDAAKRGFTWRFSSPMSEYVRLLASAGRHDDALEASERARGRAFLDLLASVESPQALLMPVPPPVAPDEPAPWVPLAARDVTPDRVEPLLRLRGGADPVRARTPEPDISTEATAEPPRLATLVAQAARLRSHLLCYWVTDNSLLVWVVAPDGQISHREVSVSRAALAALVDQALPTLDTPARGSGDRLTIPGNGDAAARTLYRHLIAPVAPLLPLDGRGLLTIVPHGPLHRVSFAALRAPSGRYLVEQTALHYSSSVSALAFTGTRRGGADGGPLVIADPRTAPDATLASLPGAIEEGRAVSRALGADRTTVLRGASATEQAFRGAVADANVVHVAAHGVVKDDDPFGSYLALAGAGRAPDGDGRLTSAEVYRLRLSADLVVLSGCRTAVGPITGEGMLGLTRGFFAAGAPSVVASLWDVSDTVTASLFTRFYAEWPARASKADALRRAQLQLIADLRAGRKTVDTPAGRFTLPEHPSLWAGLVLIGEP